MNAVLIAPAVHVAPIYDVQRNQAGEYVIVQLLLDGTWQEISVGYKHATGAWAKVGRMVTLKQREPQKVA